MKYFNFKCIAFTDQTRHTHENIKSKPQNLFKVGLNETNNIRFQITSIKIIKGGTSNPRLTIKM